MSKRLPSTDLYFSHACRDWEKSWWRPGPVVALGANCFLSGDTMLLVRRDDGALMERAIGWQGRLIYVIDDDIAAAADNSLLPPDYRRRLVDFDRRHHARLLHRADVIVVPSARLEALFRQDRRITATTMRIDPYWPIPIADQKHYGELDWGSPLKIVHLGSGSHAGGLAAIGPVIARLLRDRDDLTFTYFGDATLPALDKTGIRVCRISPMSWPRYRRWLARQRFHLAVYPLDGTPFDAARSSNKLVEHAIVGAAGIYPENWEPAHALDGAALFASPNASEWEDAIVRALDHRRSLVDMAAIAGRILEKKNVPTIQRELWRKLLGIEAAGTAT